MFNSSTLPLHTLLLSQIESADRQLVEESMADLWGDVSFAIYDTARVLLLLRSLQRNLTYLGLTHFTNRPLCVAHGERTLELFLQPQPSFEVGEKLVFFPIFIPKVHKLILVTLIKNTEGNLTSLTDFGEKVRINSHNQTSVKA